MKRDELVELEAKVMEEVVSRRKLGGFDANASTILFLTEIKLEVVRHLKDQAPRK